MYLDNELQSIHDEDFSRSQSRKSIQKTLSSSRSNYVPNQTGNYTNFKSEILSYHQYDSSIKDQEEIKELHTKLDRLEGKLKLLGDGDLIDVLARSSIKNERSSIKKNRAENQENTYVESPTILSDNDPENEINYKSTFNLKHKYTLEDSGKKKGSKNPIKIKKIGKTVRERETIEIIENKTNIDKKPKKGMTKRSSVVNQSQPLVEKTKRKKESVMKTSHNSNIITQPQNTNRKEIFKPEPRQISNALIRKSRVEASPANEKKLDKKVFQLQHRLNIMEKNLSHNAFRPKTNTTKRSLKANMSQVSLNSMEHNFDFFAPKPPPLHYGIQTDKNRSYIRNPSKSASHRSFNRRSSKSVYDLDTQLNIKKMNINMTNRGNMERMANRVEDLEKKLEGVTKKLYDEKKKNTELESQTKKLGREARKTYILESKYKS